MLCSIYFTVQLSCHTLIHNWSQLLNVAHREAVFMLSLCYCKSLPFYCSNINLHYLYIAQFCRNVCVWKRTGLHKFCPELVLSNKGGKIEPVVHYFVEALSKLLIMAPKLWGTCGSEQQDSTATGPGDHAWCCTMDTVMLTEASFVFWDGHGINFVEIHNVVKFLANGL